MAEFKKNLFEDLKNSPHPHYDPRNKRIIIGHLLRHLRPDISKIEIEKYLPHLDEEDIFPKEQHAQFSIFAPELLYRLAMSRVHHRQSEYERKKKFFFIHKPETELPSNRAPYSGISYFTEERKNHVDYENRRTIIADFALFKELSIIIEKPIILGYEKTYTALSKIMLENIFLFYKRLRKIGRALPGKKRKIENITPDDPPNPLEKFASNAELAQYEAIKGYCYYSLGAYLWITRPWNEHLKLIKQGLIGPNELIAMLRYIYSYGVHSGEVMKLFREEGIPVEIYRNLDSKSMGYLISFLLSASLLHQPAVNEFFIELGLALLNSDTFLQKLPTKPSQLALLLLEIFFNTAAEAYLKREGINRILDKSKKFIQCIQRILKQTTDLKEYCTFFSQIQHLKGYHLHFIKDLLDYQTSLGLIASSDSENYIQFLTILKSLGLDMFERFISEELIQEKIKPSKYLESLYKLYYLGQIVRKNIIESIIHGNITQEFKLILTNLNVQDPHSVAKTRFLKFFIDIVRIHSPNTMNSLGTIFHETFQFDKSPKFQDSAHYKNYCQLLHMFSIYFPDVMSQYWTENNCVNIIVSFLDYPDLRRDLIFLRRGSQLIKEPPHFKYTHYYDFDNPNYLHHTYFNWYNFGYNLLFSACHEEAVKYSQIIITMFLYERLRRAFEKEDQQLEKVSQDLSIFHAHTDEIKRPPQRYEGLMKYLVQLEKQKAELTQDQWGFNAKLEFLYQKIKDLLLKLVLGVSESEMKNELDEILFHIIIIFPTRTSKGILKDLNELLVDS